MAWQAVRSLAALLTPRDAVQKILQHTPEPALDHVARRAKKALSRLEVVTSDHYLVGRKCSPVEACQCTPEISFRCTCSLARRGVIALCLVRASVLLWLIDTKLVNEYQIGRRFGPTRHQAASIIQPS